MDLYKLTEKSLTAIEKIPFSLEKDIQNIVEENLDELFSLAFVCSEFTIGEFRLDTLCYNEESNSFVIIEYKRGSSYSVIDQGYSYLSAMLSNKSDFILEYNETMSNSLKRDDIDWAASRVIFISPAFNSYQKNSVNFKDVPFDLWEIRRFKGGFISLEQHRPSSRESIDKFSKSNSVISDVSSVVKVYKEEDLISNSSEKLKNLWDELRERLLELDDTNLGTSKYYVSLKKGNKIVCYIKFRKQHIQIVINRGNSKPDGCKSKNFFNIDDPKNLSEESSFTWKNGLQGHRYKLAIKSKTDIDYIMLLIKQKHESVK